MFTYQARPRVLRSRCGKQPTFPSEVEVSFHFKPLQPFGMAQDGGVTAVKDSRVTIHFNANTGHHSVEAEKPLRPLHVSVDTPLKISWEGNRLTVKTTCNDWESLRVGGIDAIPGKMVRPRMDSNDTAKMMGKGTLEQTPGTFRQQLRRLARRSLRDEEVIPKPRE